MNLRPSRLASLLAVIALTACNAATTGAPTTQASGVQQTPGQGGALTSLKLLFAPTQALPALVAKGEGFFEKHGIDADVSAVDEDVPPFIAGQTEVASISAWEVADYISEGEDMVVFGTAGQPSYFNGVAVRADDASRYSTIKDLVGKKLGQPGFGTGTWPAFEGFVRDQYGINAREDFQVVEASPGALLGLLQTGQIDGALLFSGQTLSALGSADFKLIFRFDNAWKEVTNEPLSIGNLVARPGWLQDNQEVARGIIDALNEAVDWMGQNTKEFAKGGKYESAASDVGWLRDDATNAAVQDVLQKGEYYQTQSLYTPTYIDSTYRFVQLVTDNAPSKEKLFSQLFAE